MRKDTLTYKQVLSDLQKKIYHPVYFFTGDEPYYINKLTDYIMKNVLTESEKSFNQTVLYGKDTDAATVSNAAKRFPMMANNQVVILKEAQELKDFDQLIYYFQKPLKSTILVINYKYKSLDRRKKIFKELEEHAVIFESKKLYDDKIPDWIASLLREKNYSIEPKAAILLSEFLGNDLSKIENELEKLLIILPENLRIITSDHIEKNIGISKEYNNFELHKALANRDVIKSNQIIQYFAANPKNNPIILTITSLFYFFSKVLSYHFLKDKSPTHAATVLKVKPFFVQDFQKAARLYSAKKVVDIISILREYDVKSKGYGSNESEQGELLKELIFKILH